MDDLVCSYRKTMQILPFVMNDMKLRSEVVRRCRNYDPAKDKKGFKPSCVYCRKCFETPRRE